MFALIMGSNLGANITLIGALAGIMWRSILKFNNVNISYFEFAKIGLCITPTVIAVACAILSIEMLIFPN